ncbi:peptidylprolyl isomerase [Guyparkeria halopsychrophila]|uniref:peptidylprolyl isomerase n=1 Tax=Guyparkeria halopsychrophila TaxID=3139421 RepID=UPI0037C9A039
MDSKLTTDRIPHRRHRLAIALSAGLLISAGAMTGCSDDRPQSAEKTPLGQQGNSSDAFATIEGGEVIARINGSPLYRENLEVVKENLGAEVPEERLVSRMVELRLLANRAREQGLDSAPRTQARVQNAIDNQLANAYLMDFMTEIEVDDAEVEAAYERQMEALGEETQYRAMHILVEDEETARELIAELDQDGDFAELAQEHSKDTGSGESGGDLGWFSLDQMVEPFAEAVGALEPGQRADNPVETQFGWHIIRLEETRPLPKPTLEQMRPELEDQARRDAINDMIAELRESANVEILTSDVRSMVERDDDQAEANDEAGSTEETAEETAEDAENGDDAEGADDAADIGNLPAEPLKAMP